MPETPWSVIRAERHSLAKDLRSLNTRQWTAQSLCADWTVHQLLGHITATTKMTPSRFVRGYVASGFSVDRFNARGVAAETRGNPTETLAEFQSHLDSETSPPGDMEAMVGEIIIHSEDIRRPLGIAHRYSPEVLTRVADFFAAPIAPLGAKPRRAGLKFVATDAAWTRGTGLTVTGPLLSLILAMAGRKAALIDLDGDGVQTLLDRP